MLRNAINDTVYYFCAWNLCCGTPVLQYADRHVAVSDVEDAGTGTTESSGDGVVGETVELVLQTRL